jgi:hypothetical protein
VRRDHVVDPSRVTWLAPWRKSTNPDRVTAPTTIRTHQGIVLDCQLEGLMRAIDAARASRLGGLRRREWLSR